MLGFIQYNSLYGISKGSARLYMRDYRSANDLLPRSSGRGNFSYSQLAAEHTTSTLEILHSMTKDELIREVVKARVSEARTKKDTARKELVRTRNLFL